MSKIKSILKKGDDKPRVNEISQELIELEHELKAVNPKVFEGIPVGKKREILQSMSFTLIQEKMHSGPLPDAETLVKYNSVIPNGADRIMKMAENQQSHRIKIENKVIQSQSNQSIVGQIFGLILGLVGLACGTFLAYNGIETVGAIIAGGTVVSLVSVFVIGKKTQRKSIED